MPPALTIMRKVGPLDESIIARLATQQSQQVTRAAGEGKRTSDYSKYLHLLGINRLSGWIDNDYPHDMEITDALIAATEGFGIAGEDAKIIAEFDSLIEAEAAKAGAKVEMKVDIQLPKARV